jgi:hypothetical protein
MRKLVLLASISLAACHDPPTPSEVRARITSDLGNVLHATKAAVDGTTLPSGSTFDTLSKAWSVPSISTAVARVLPARRPIIAADPGTDGFDPDAIIDKLNNELFTDANSLGDGVFSVPADYICPSVTDSTGTHIDATCADHVANADLRIRVSEDDDALVFAVQVDANHDEPLSFELTHKSLAASVNLDEAAQAMTALAPVFGEDVPNAQLSGQITGKLTVLGDAKIEASSTIDRDLAIATADAGVDLNGPGAFRLTSAAAEVFAITIDGGANGAGFELGLGATTAHLPTDDVDLDLPGITASAQLAEGLVTVTGISLGDRTTTLSKAGARAIAIDLNPNDGRTLDATITATGTDDETLSVSPKLDLHMAVDHAVLGDTPPVYDVTQLSLTGALHHFVDAAGIEHVQVQGGPMSIVTNPAQYGITATDGQCVTATDVSGANGSYTQWIAGACN